MLVTFSSNVADEDWNVLATTPWVYVPFPVRMNLTTSLNLQGGLTSGKYKIVAKTSQLGLSLGDNGKLKQWYNYNNYWGVKDVGNGM